MAPAQRTTPARYKYVAEEKAGGATFTPNRLASFVARQIVANVSAPKNETLRVIDPAAGEGTLLVCLLEELVSHGFRNIEVHGFDTNPNSLSVAQKAIQARFPFVATRFRASDFLEFADQSAGRAPSLFTSALVDRFDVIIANPPYVRTQIMGASHAQTLASHFGLSGRVDLYHAFILGMIEMLEENGVAGIIVSNRFMTTKSGAVVRKALRESVCIKHIWDLGDTKLFDAAVLPAVMIVTKGEPAGVNGNPAFTSIYETDAPACRRVQDVVAALGGSGTVATEDGRRFQVTHGELNLSTALDGIWHVATDEGDAWLRRVEGRTWRTFGAIGSIRVGIKTCADKVFIRSDWERMPESERPELLRPLITHHVGRRFKADTTKGLRQVLYPHLIKDGRRVAADLSRYPRAATYLESHRPTLEGRAYVIEAGRRWYEIWVPQDPGAWGLPKIVFRDICEAPTFWLDLDGCVVNGDCYWLALGRHADINLLWLAVAVANSCFIEAFYDHRFHNKLYAGRRRFMTQYVEHFPLPDPSREASREMIELAKRIYDLIPVAPTEDLESRLDSMVWQAFGVSVEKVGR
jgi:16S rRNA G966 N2-methylase RsmD